MATFISGAYTDLNTTKSLQVVYRNKALENYHVDFVEEIAGLQPSMLTLNFPLIHTWENQFSTQYPFYVYIDRTVDNIPKFVGYIRSHTQDCVNGLTVTLQDLRCRLFDYPITREFNKKDTDGDFVPDDSGVAKSWTTRDVLDYCYTQYQAFTTSDPIELQMNISNIPDRFAGHIASEGKPIGDVMQDVVQSVNEKCFSWKLDYLPNNACRLSVFDYESPTGSSYCVLGTDPTAYIYQQSNGIANIETQTIETSVFSGYNQVNIVADPMIVETAVQLEEVWDSTLETAVISDYKKYTQKSDGEDANPDYDIQACDVWKRFRIPKINDNGVLRRVKLYDKCISSHHELVDQYGVSVDVTPFIVLQYNGVSTTYKPILDGFNIKNDEWLIFNKPLFQVQDGSTETYRVPDAVYLNFAYVSDVKGTYTYPPSVSGMIRQHRESTEGYFFHTELNNFWLKSSLAGGTAKGDTDTLEYNSTQYWAKNDIALLEQYTKDVYAKVSKEIIDLPVELGRLETHYKIGSQLWVNNKNTDTVIMNIRYEMTTDSVKTSLHAKNGDS